MERHPREISTPDFTKHLHSPVSLESNIEAVEPGLSEAIVFLRGHSGSQGASPKSLSSSGAALR